MTNHLTDRAELLRFLADRIDAGEVESVDVHYDMQPSTAEPVSPRQMVYQIAVTMPATPNDLGYIIDGTKLPNYPQEQPIAEVVDPANEVVQGIARSIVSGQLHTGNRWSPNPEDWPAQMRRDWARWQPDAARWRQ